MPHCIVEYGTKPSDLNPNALLKQLQQIMQSSGLFDLNAIKLRAKCYQDYTLPTTYEGFIHVTVHLLEGRNLAQKNQLAQSIQKHLESQWPSLAICITTAIVEVDRSSYQKR